MTSETKQHRTRAGLLDLLVRRIVDTAHPLSVILFGSRARGANSPDSDYDLLIVVPDGVHPRRVAGELYAAKIGLDLAADLVVVNASTLAKQARNPGLIYQEALQTGRELYARPSAS